MFGIIGLGGIYFDAYRETMIFLKRNNVIVYDIDKKAQESAILYAKDRGIEYVSANSIVEVFNTAEDICLFVPPKAIIPIIKEGLSGIGSIKTRKIYIEKPLGVSLGDALEIFKLLKARGIILHYNEVFLHSSTTDVLVEEIQSGRLGKVKSIQMHFNGGIPKNITEQWRGKSETGGLVWHDWGIHSIGLLLGILKRMSIDYSKIDTSRITVKNCIWQNIDFDEILVHSLAELQIEEIDVSIEASWINRNDSEMRIYFDNDYYLEITIGKIEGVSSWNLFEVDSQNNRRLLTQSRYPKERFIRSLTAFISNRNPDFTNYKLGLKAMEIVDYLFKESRNKLE